MFLQMQEARIKLGVMITLEVQLPRHFLGKYQWEKVGRKHDYESDARLLPAQKGNVDIVTRKKTYDEYSQSWGEQYDN